MIRPRGVDETSGLVPDHLIVTRSSLGYFWHVVELKHFDVQFADRTGNGSSAETKQSDCTMQRVAALIEFHARPTLSCPEIRTQ